MRKKLRPYLMLLTLVTIASACSKDDDPVASKTSLLTAHEWKFSTANDADPTIKALTIALYTGASYKFNTNGTYTGKAGDALSNEAIAGTWAFDNTETKIVFEKGTADEETFDVVTLSGDKLAIKFETVTLEFKK